MTQTLEQDAATTPQQRVDAWLGDFEAALKARDVQRAAGLFAADKLLARPDLILVEHHHRREPGRRCRPVDRDPGPDRPVGLRHRRAADRGRRGDDSVVHVRDRRRPRQGLLRLVEEDGEAKAWTLLTTMYELKGHEEPRGDARPMGAEHGAHLDRTTWLERRQQEDETLGVTTQPYVLVIGGGQGGIALGARLRQLGVPSLVIDKHARPGDQWRSRYKSLCLHDPVWYDHLPYLKFPDNWPVFSPKDKIGDWLESYTRVMEVPYWSSTVATSASYSDETGRVDRRGRARGQAADASARSSSCWPPGCRASRTSRTFPARTCSAATSTTRPRTPDPRRTSARRWWSSAATTRPSTSAGPSGSTASTSRWCSAPRRTS